MTMTDEPQQKIEAYVNRLRGRLRGMNAETAREIVEEMHSHIVDKVAMTGGTTADVDAVLAALGTPEELASQYRVDDLLSQAESSRSPVRILHSLFRWASLSFAGFFVLLGSLFGYFLGIVFIGCAVLKPFHPRTTGLWVSSSGGHNIATLLHGSGGLQPGARELLGWWIVPIGLVVGCGLIVLTTQFAVWCVRLYRLSRVSTHGREAA